MLCLVRQADSVILEVEVEPKAKGKQCLDKVCEMLGIIESDYLGLQYTGPHAEKLWLNLRNQLKRQIPGPPPYRLELSVKFLVPPHLILQDVTRNLFYLDVRRSFTENRLRPASPVQICHLAALIAQVELGDLDTATSPPAALLHYPKFLPPASCLTTSPERPPQIRVRWRSGGNSSESNGSRSNNNNEMEESAAEAKDEDQQVSIETDRTVVTQMCQNVLKEHALLHGVKPNAAMYQFLKEASELEDFGMEQYFVKNRNGETLRVGVGPTGILIHDLNLQLKHSIPYASIHLATQAGRWFFLTFVSTSATQALGFKLENCHSASALYRAVTEKHAFYSCETVRNAVTTQYIRDLKGTIASLFNENTALGKNYVFDIQRTCREVYDHTRRVMYQMEAGVQQSSEETLPRTPPDEDVVMENDCRAPSCKVVQEQLAAFQDSMLCRVCMDSDVCTVFFPCRHVACCGTCAPRCQNCPLCRSAITEAQHIYLPCLAKDGAACSDAPPPR